MSWLALSRGSDGLQYLDIDEHGDLTLILYRRITTRNVIQAGQDSKLSTEENIEKIHVKVSSKQLILASPKFAAQFQGNWPEARILREKGHLELSLPDEDAECWIMLLKHLHHQNDRAVRLFVDLETLTNFALLVDKHALLEGIKILGSLWIKKEEQRLPREFGKEVVSWMWISWVFQDQTLFWNMTKLAKQKSVGAIDTYNLPIKDEVISKCLIGMQVLRLVDS